MASQEMYRLGSQSSVIRELFAYGQEQCKIVGKDKVFDFSIGNPTVPAPACIKEAIEDILATRESAAIHGYTAASGDLSVRQGLAEYMNKTYQAGVEASNFYMTCGAAASLTVSLKALVEGPDDEVIVIAPFFPEYTVFIANAGAKAVVVPPDTEHFQIPMKLLKRRLRRTPGPSSSIRRTIRQASSIRKKLLKKSTLCSPRSRKKSATRFTSSPMNRTVKSSMTDSRFSTFPISIRIRSSAIPTVNPSAFRANVSATSWFRPALKKRQKSIRLSAVPAGPWASSAHLISSRMSY